MAVCQGHEKCAELLIEAGSRLEANPDGGYAPLPEAASAGRINCVKLLINSGADVNAKDNNSDDTALHRAVQNGKTDVAE